MSASVLQAIYSSAASGTATQAITVTAGSSIMVWVQVTAASGTTNSCSDTHNGSYGSAKDNVTDVAGSGANITSWNIDSSIGGATTVTVTFSTSLNYLMYVVEIGGTTGLIAHTGQPQNSPGAGTDAVTSGTVLASTAPGLVVGFTQDQTFTTVIAPGSGFSSNGATFGAMVESRNVAITGNYAATYTSSDGASSSFVTLVAIYHDAPTAPQNQIAWITH